ncbi:hypothetical protein HYN46_16980 [Aquirhabdus parva]|uniref:Uncharacterized protein n=1 Tax=Aquirhabdus parva TaxID=2283318 RepID=A0A345P2C5_9GAMM|nr:hypothetical protein HYN46_00065 [Aquirhabdus parva]AXI04380.1 hypothetical protein HYN46_16980 [Aquirhabdus parva]
MNAYFSSAFGLAILAALVLLVFSFPIQTVIGIILLLVIAGIAKWIKEASPEKRETIIVSILTIIGICCYFIFRKS